MYACFRQQNRILPITWMCSHVLMESWNLAYGKYCGYQTVLSIWYIHLETQHLVCSIVLKYRDEPQYDEASMNWNRLLLILVFAGEVLLCRWCTEWLFYSWWNSWNLQILSSSTICQGFVLSIIQAYDYYFLPDKITNDNSVWGLLITLDIHNLL